MCGVSSHGSSTQLFFQGNKSCSLQPSHDFFIACNHFVTKSALSWDPDVQILGGVVVRGFIARICRARPKQAEQSSWQGREEGGGIRAFITMEALCQITNPPAKKRSKKVTGGDPADPTSPNQ